MSDPEYLLDTSALMALLLNEPGADLVSEILDRSSIHAVNLAEIVRKLVSAGFPIDALIERLSDLNLEVIEKFSTEQAHAMGRIAVEAKRLGLSLGDCVCLTVAEWLGMVAVTTEQRWSELGRISRSSKFARPQRKGWGRRPQNALGSAIGMNKQKPPSHRHPSESAAGLRRLPTYLASAIGRRNGHLQT